MNPLSQCQIEITVFRWNYLYKTGLFSGFAFGKKKEIELHYIFLLNLTFVFFLKCGKLHFRTFYVGYT